MSDNGSSTSGGIGVFGLLGITFIVLKLLGKIDWPWIWVTAPLWMPFILATVIILGIMAVWILAEILTHKK